jgi:SAM-dependent methyltransferase
VRKGVRALSHRYVEARARADPGDPLDGHGKRAAFATYFAALHFIVTWDTLETLGAPLETVRRVVDVGCGTGACGAAVARFGGGRASLLGIDRSGWALGEARHTCAAFGVRARFRRGALPGALPARTGRGDALVAGWCLNELAPGARERVVAAFLAARARGARLLLLEPLAGWAAPWWDELAARVTALGGEAAIVRRALGLPAWIERMDRAASLDHSVVGARALFA